MPSRNESSVRSLINTNTGAGRRIARSTSPVGDQARAMRSASVFLTQKPTPGCVPLPVASPLAELVANA